MIGTKIILRAVEPKDVDLLYQWENDMDVWHVSNTIEPFSRFTLEQYVMNAQQDIFTSKQLRLMIDLKGTSETIGSIDLFDFEPLHMRAGVAILIIEKERNKGYASEALHLMIDYALHTLNLHQLYCNIGSDNTNSLQLFKKKGFEMVGVKKDWLKRDDKWQDEIMFQLINK